MSYQNVIFALVLVGSLSSCVSISRSPNSQASSVVENQQPAFFYSLDLNLRGSGAEIEALIPYRSFLKTELNINIDYPSHSTRRGEFTSQVVCYARSGVAFTKGFTLEQKVVSLSLFPDFDSCKLIVFSPEREVFQTLVIKAEEERFPFMKNLYTFTEHCNSPSISKLKTNSPLLHFWTSDVAFLSCPTAISDLEVISADYPAFNARWKALTGGDFPRESFDKFDTQYEPDWSKIPKLDFVWVSSLVWKADFYGAMIAKAVRKQAERGALVKVLYSNLLMEKIDRRFVDRLRIVSPNLQVDDYVFRPEDFNLLNPIRRLHRSMHAKLFVTYSESDPSLNIVIGGGSNLYDGFLFSEASDIKGNKNLIRYTERKAKWAHFEDSDYIIRNPKVTQQVLAQLLRLWARTDADHLADPTLKVSMGNPDKVSAGPHLGQEPSSTSSFVRNIISVPYTDEKNLEKFYVQLFDSAQRKITIVTPLLHFTRAIAAAIGRALEREVEIDIITNFSVQGTPWPKIHTEMNSRFANKYFGRVKAWKWNKLPHLLHAKIVMVDEETAFLGSVNLNHRSFYHDIENGVLVTGPKALAEVATQIQRYRDSATEVDQKIKLSPEYQLLYLFIADLL